MKTGMSEQEENAPVELLIKVSKAFNDLNYCLETRDADG